MAIKTRAEAVALEEKLLAQGDEFSFYQSHRLLRLLLKREGLSSDLLRTLPDLSLAFPETDIQSIDAIPTGGYRVTANLLGLYGATSPLPNFYTEDLIDERQLDAHGQKAFIDMFNQTLYPLLFSAWIKSRVHLRMIEEGEDLVSEILSSFLGFTRCFSVKNDLPEIMRPFAGIIFQNPKSLQGLKTILSGCFPVASVDIIQQDLQKVDIAPDQHLLLGQQNHSLGVEAHIGQEVNCRSGNLTIKLNELDLNTFRNLLPNGDWFDILKSVVRYYLDQPLNIMLTLSLHPDHMIPAQLSMGEWSMLGYDTWVGASQGSQSTLSFPI